MFAGFQDKLAAEEPWRPFVLDAILKRRPAKIETFESNTGLSITANFVWKSRQRAQRGSVSVLRTASLIHCHSNYHQWSPGFAIQPQNPGDWCLHALKCLWRYFWHSTADRLLIYWRFGSRIVGRRNINLSNLPLLIGRKRLSRPRRWEALSGRRLGQQNKWCVLNAPITAETFRYTMNLTWLYADEGGPLLLLLKCWRNECVQPWGLSGILMSHS